jgi:hypothetical protein
LRNVYLLAAAQALAASGTFTIVLLGGILGAVLAGLSSLGVAWAVEQQNFVIFCAAIFVMGANLACVHQYRFAAVEFLEPARAR